MITVKEVAYNLVVDEASSKVIDAREVVSIAGSTGDMTKNIYDSDNDHIVDVSANSLKFANKTIDEFIKTNDYIDCGTF